MVYKIFMEQQAVVYLKFPVHRQVASAITEALPTGVRPVPELHRIPRVFGLLQSVILWLFRLVVHPFGKVLVCPVHNLVADMVHVLCQCCGTTWLHAHYTLVSQHMHASLRLHDVIC